MEVVAGTHVSEPGVNVASNLICFTKGGRVVCVCLGRDFKRASIYSSSRRGSGCNFSTKVADTTNC